MRDSFISAQPVVRKPVPTSRVATPVIERTATRHGPIRSVLVAISIGLACSLVGCGDDDFDAACSSWCTVVDDCTETSFSECMDACAEESSQAQAISSECAGAVRNQNVCLGELTCAEFEAWADEIPPDSYPCKSADDDVDSVCIR
jgi:hypothetical protein